MKRLITRAMAVTVVAMVTNVFAVSTLNVPADYATIAMALEAADPGDTILLAPGTYDATGCAAEGFMITLDEGVTLKGAGATPTDTVITGGETRQVLNIISADATVENLTLRDGLAVGSSSGAGYTLQMSGGLVTNCIITGGEPVKAATFETAVYATGGRITGCEITGVLADTTANSYAYFQRTPVYLKNATMDHCDIHGNLSSHKYLGLVTVEGANGLVEFCKIYDNSLKGFEYGYRDGAVLAMNGATVRDSGIYNNTMAYSRYTYYPAAGVSTLGGYGVTFTANNYGGAVIERCAITNNIFQLNTDQGNSYNKYMAVGVMMGYKSVLRNCLVANNANTTTMKRSSYVWPVSGGVVISPTCGAGASVVNCTIISNSVSVLAQDPNLANGWFGVGAVTNSIIKGAFLLDEEATTEFSHCCTDALMPGEGNVTGDCAFKDPEAADYHLTIDSAVVRDKALPIDEVTVDLDGVERPFGAAPDIGCYEYFSESIYSCSFKMESESVATKKSFALTATADPADGVYAYVWTFDKGGVKTVVSNFTDRVHCQSLSAPGEYSVSLEVLWGDEEEIVGTAEAPQPQSLVAYPRTTFVAVGGTGVWPYDTPENAAGSFLDAYAAVYKCDDDPGIVQLAPGTYDATGCSAEGFMITLDEGVTLKGAGATPADTIITGGETRQVLNITSAAATVENLTLRDGLAAGSGTGAGYTLQMSGGLVTNCVISGGEPVRAAFETAVYATGGRITGCEITGVLADKTASTYGAYQRTPIYLKNATMDHCDIHGNFSTHKYLGLVTVEGANGLVEFCRIHDNSLSGFEYAYRDGAVAAMDGATVRDSEIYNNTMRFSVHSSYTAAAVSTIGGSGISCYPTSQGGAVIERCIITNNVYKLATDMPNSKNEYMTAGVMMGYKSVLRNCLVVNNANTATMRSQYAWPVSGGVVISPAYGSGASVVNCTVAGNTVSELAQDPGLANGWFVAGAVTNTIIKGAFQLDEGATTEFSHCCTDALMPGEGNIDKDPRLKVKKGYQIRSSSPCVDAGDPMGWTEGDVDLAGNPRLRNGKIDMGCYQSILQGLMLLMK